ncbi:MAG: hypothetical protein OXK76_02295 [Gammaproteobacteria bacterium]|nr:hypothetical protein [Gammaproteobacteria bacterium]
MAISVDNLGERAIAALAAVWQEAAAFVPNLLAALVILVIGYVASRIAASIIRRMLTALGFERLGERIGIGRVLQRMEVTKTASHIVGRLVRCSPLRWASSSAPREAPLRWPSAWAPGRPTCSPAPICATTTPREPA